MTYMTYKKTKSPRPRTPEKNKRHLQGKVHSIYNNRSQEPITVVLRNYFRHLASNFGVRSYKDIPTVSSQDHEYYMMTQGHTHECHHPMFEVHKRAVQKQFALTILKRNLKELLKSEHDEDLELSQAEKEFFESLLVGKKGKAIAKILDTRENHRFRVRTEPLRDENGNIRRDAKGNKLTKRVSLARKESLGYAIINRQSALQQFFDQKSFEGLQFVDHFHVEPNAYTFIHREMTLMLFGKYLLLQVDALDGNHTFEYFDLSDWSPIPLITLSVRKHVKKEVDKFDKIVERVATLAPSFIRKVTYYGGMLNELHRDIPYNRLKLEAVRNQLLDRFLALRMKKGESPALYYKAFFNNKAYQTDDYVYWLWLLYSTLRIGRVVGVELKKQPKHQENKREFKFGENLELKFNKSLSSEVEIDKFTKDLFGILAELFGDLPE